MMTSSSAAVNSPDWHLLSSHARVLVCLARDPDARLRDVALSVDLTERAVQSIINDLHHAGFLRKERSGRRNHYELDLKAKLDHPLEDGFTLGELLAGLNPGAG